jgi:hypothetical protein
MKTKDFGFIIFLVLCGIQSMAFVQPTNCFANATSIITDLKEEGMGEEPDLNHSIRVVFENGGCIHLLKKLERSQLVVGPSLLFERLPRYVPSSYKSRFFRFLNNRDVYKKFEDINESHVAHLIIQLGYNMVAAFVLDKEDASHFAPYIRTLTQPIYSLQNPLRLPFVIYTDQFDPERSNVFRSTLVHENIHAQDISKGLTKKLADKIDNIMAKEPGWSQASALEFKDAMLSLVMESRAHLAQAHFEKSIDPHFDQSQFLIKMMGTYIDRVASSLNKAKNKETVNSTCDLFQSTVPQAARFPLFSDRLPYCSEEGVHSLMRDFEVMCLGPGNAVCLEPGRFRFRATYSDNSQIKSIKSWPNDTPEFLKHSLRTSSSGDNNSDILWEDEDCKCLYFKAGEYTPH